MKKIEKQVERISTELQNMVKAGAISTDAIILIGYDIVCNNLAMMNRKESKAKLCRVKSVISELRNQGLAAKNLLTKKGDK